MTRRMVIAIGASTTVLLGGAIALALRSSGDEPIAVQEVKPPASMDEGVTTTIFAEKSIIDDDSDLIDVIVTFEDGVDAERELAILQPYEVRHVFKGSLNGASLTVTKQALKSLRDSPNVARVERDTEVYPMGRSGSTSWGLDRIDQSFLPLSNSFDPPSAGRGVRIYLVDTGVETGHREFAQADIETGHDIVAEVDPRSVGEKRRDCLGHGTSVASAIVGATVGVAPGATLVPVRTIDCDGDAASDVIAALDWILSDAKDRPVAHAVVNIGLNGERSASLDAAVDHVVAAGITVVVPAGNLPVNACNLSPSGARSALTVGATDDQDRLAESSGHGECVDLYAPGIGIPSVKASTSSQLVSTDGTSMASAYVSGAIAVLAEAFGGSSEELVMRLLERSTPGVVNGVDKKSVGGLLCLPGKDVFSFPSVVLPSAMENVEYGPVDLAISGGSAPYVWNLVDGRLPRGLTLSSTGSLMGTPKSDESSTFTVEVASNSCGRATQEMTLQIVPELRITTSRLAETKIGVRFSATLGARGGTKPYTWSASGPLPPGLRILKDGSIVGTPTERGIFGLSVTVTDANGFSVAKDVAVSVRP